VGTQAKLLRVLEDHKLRRLEARWKRRSMSGCWPPPTRFRMMPLLRVNCAAIFITGLTCSTSMPPLREHKEDIPDLVQLLISEMSAKHNRKAGAVSEAVMNLFNNFTWPGNVRELRNTSARRDRMRQRHDRDQTSATRIRPCHHAHQRA